MTSGISAATLYALEATPRKRFDESIGFVSHSLSSDTSFIELYSITGTLLPEPPKRDAATRRPITRTPIRVYVVPFFLLFAPFFMLLPFFDGLVLILFFSFSPPNIN